MTQQIPSDKPLVSPGFKLILGTVAGLTVLSLVVSIGLGIFISRQPKRTDLTDLKNLVETCSTTFKMGFGAIVGLIGGKAIH